ncbi:MAG TPA: SUMF1/EgtB/PvdO family nonheme iron enzyme [Dictyobacter sp.]|jgi:hypothetical protein|nr:SUMF1/EgtB/PvdO family nonheme iron enzyme [Dictyobacter sp.]
MEAGQRVYLPTLEQWDRLSFQECQNVVDTIVGILPPDFQSVKLETCQMGNQQRYMAFFEWHSKNESSLFVFIPGGNVTIGYDRTHPFLLTPAQLHNFQQETVARGYLSCTLDVFLDRVLTSLRQVIIQPCLLQVHATSSGDIPTKDQRKRKIHSFILFDEMRDFVHQQGFRLPTSDEWEYACAAGARTLFRWGNDSPNTYMHLPDMDEDDVPENEQMELNMPWDIHCRPNGFGLFIATNPYHWELCMDADIVLRGGDGGTALHAGAGMFVEWLTLSTFYQRRDIHIFKEHGGVHGMFARRLYPLYI